mgnify:CR=1 FL=1
MDFMAISYERLWKLLIDKGLKKSDLERMANISHYTINKLNHGGNLTMDVISRICLALNCTPDEIMEILPDKVKAVKDLEDDLQ